MSGLVSLPPSRRSRVALGLTVAAALGRFELQVCRDCSAVQYPPREACHRCLSARLQWRVQPTGGELLASTSLAHSLETYFRERLPWRVGLVRLDCGPTAVVHLHDDVPPAPARVNVGVGLDKAGRAVLLAGSQSGLEPILDFPMSDDRLSREMTCNPKSRRILVTDATGEVGVALVKALIEAGAQTVWAGHCAAAIPARGFADLEGLQGVALVSLDVADDDSVRRCAAQIGQQVDILINTAEHHATEVPERDATAEAQAEMQVNYLGLLRLAGSFGPLMRESRATAWVNLLSIYALTNLPAQGTFCASKAAAYSYSQALRAEMRTAGVRVIQMFPGPVDVPANRMLAPPKLTPAALAAAMVRALQSAVEDVFPGDVAQEWLARWRENPLVLEREITVAPVGEQRG